MAQRVEVQLTDDLDGVVIPAGKGQTVAFGLDGKSYEIDLSNKNAASFRKVLAPYVDAGRLLRNTRGARVTRTHIGADNHTIKQWARSNGYEVNDRGRIPKEIREAFEAAN
jgi:nucleoid-associated protein Lsr2